MPYCSKCGKENKSESKFCFNCGNSLLVSQAPIQKQESKKSLGEKKSIEKTNGGLSKQQINSIILIAALIGLIVSGFFAWDNFKSDYDRLVKKQNNDDVVIDTLNSVLQNTNSSNSSLSDSSQQTINDTLTTSP